MKWELFRWLFDICVGIATFVLVTAVGYWLHQQGVDVPSPQDWLLAVGR